MAFGWYGLLRNLGDLFVCRIVPYFESRVASYPDTQEGPFTTGILLARNCRLLDERAAEAGVRRLSEFGFRDDRDWQRLIWHPASEGLRTVEALIAVTQDTDGEKGLRDDLLRLQQYLQKAEAKGIRFCLIVRAGLDKMISPMEMEARIGCFW